MKISDAIGSLVQGLHRTEAKVAETADKIAKGDISAEAFVEQKLNEHTYKAQAKTLKTVTELEDELLDIIA